MSEPVVTQTTAPTDAGKTTEPWYNGAAPELVGYVQNKKWENPLQVVDAYKNLESFHGVPKERLLKLPADDNVDEWGKVWTRLGRPESFDKYGDIEAPEGMQLNKDLISKFDEVFFKSNAPKSVRDNAVKAYLEMEKQLAGENAKQAEAVYQNELADLKTDWGTKYDERLELSRRAIRAGLPEGVDKDEMVIRLEKALGPKLAGKLFANLAEKANLAEDIMPGTQGGQKFGRTVEQALADKAQLISEIKGDPVRLSAYNQGTGGDILKMKTLDEFIVNNR